MTTTNLVELTIPQPEPITDGTAMVERVNAMTITDADSYQSVATVRISARTRYNQIEEQRKKLKEPSLKAGRLIDEFFNPVLVAFEQAGRIATQKLQAYDDEQRRKAEIERKRAEEAAKKERQDREMALSEISGIQQQVIIAQMGRSGVRKGGSLQCIDDTLAETEKWPITDRFGIFQEAAQKTKDTAVASIKALRESFVVQQERARIDKEQADAKAAGDAERIKKAEEDSKAARASEVEATKQRLRAERQLEDQQQTTAAATQESISKTLVLETQADEAKPQVVHVPGLQRPKVWKWRLKDKTKLSPDLLLIDEKAITKIVGAMKERAHPVVGEGAIEIYQEETLRQSAR